MTVHAVIGASSGTGEAITRLLAARGDRVIAVSRRPGVARENVTPAAVDVLDAAVLEEALPAGLDTVFFTVDIHGFRKPRAEIHDVMVRGCIHAMEAAIAKGARRFVLLSVLGAEDSSWVWWLLNAAKPGMQANVLQREQALKASGLPYIIVRAPRLDDTKPTHGHRLIPSRRQVLQMKPHISRQELAGLLVQAADAGSSYEGATWDIT